MKQELPESRIFKGEVRTDCAASRRMEVDISVGT